MTGVMLLQAQAPAPAGGAPGGPAGCAAQGGQFVPFALIFVVFYFLVLRPQQKRQREMQDWLKSLKKGDDVVTAGGIIGKITSLDEKTVTIEVQDKGVKLKLLRSYVTGKAPGSDQPGPEPEPPR